MKAIINGKRFDTEKADEIGVASYGDKGDFAHWQAALYKTPRAGTYFLAGHGGPMTRWARKVDGRSWTGGEGIIPLTSEEALEWAEKHLPTEVVEDYFGDQIEDAS